MHFFQTTPRMWMGPGAINTLPIEVAAMSATRAMIIVGPNVKRAGHADRVAGIIGSSGAECGIISDVEPEPSLQTAERVAGEARRFGADLVVGIGGGSSLDVAKVASVLVANDVSLESIIGPNKVPGPGIKSILVPTTAGTGTEVTPVVVLVDKGEGAKKVIVSPHVFPDVAILDAELTVTLPQGATAYSGMDAMTHAIEAFTSRNAGPMTDLLAAEAIRLISENLRVVYRDGEDVEARDKMLFASMLAGKAFGNAGVAAVHAFAHVVGAKYGVPHGTANTIMLPHVMEFTLQADPARFAAMAGFMGEDISGVSEEEGAAGMVEAIRGMIADVGLPTRLSEYGMEKKDVTEMAEEVLKDERLLANNRREVGFEDAEAIYLKAL